MRDGDPIDTSGEPAYLLEWTLQVYGTGVYKPPNTEMNVNYFWAIPAVGM